VQLKVSFKSMMKELDIGKVAKMTGLAPSTLRHYEKKGLIKPVGRNGLRRQYNPEVIDKLRLISLYRIAGLSLDKIATLFGFDGKISIDRELLTEKADDFNRTIIQLGNIRDGLRHMANCPEKDHMQCPQFKKILRKGEF